MKKTDRLDKILKVLSDANKPVSGSDLSKIFNVSRQVIVQDIALLRASDIDIISTSKGYLVLDRGFKREIYVCHGDDKIETELNTIVDLGGKVENVFVEHRIYGRIEAALNISSRKDVHDFVTKKTLEKIKPLTELTEGCHGHRICAPNMATLDDIEAALARLNILIKEQ